MPWSSVDENILFEGTPRLNGPRGLSSYVEESAFKRAVMSAKSNQLRSVFKRLSNKDLISHTHNVSLMQMRTSQHLVLYVDSSPWMYNFKMNSAAILSEWNYLCRRDHPDLCVTKVEFRLSRMARAKGETGVVSTEGKGHITLRELSPEEENIIEECTGCIHDEKLRKIAERLMRLSYMSKNTE